MMGQPFTQTVTAIIIGLAVTMGSLGCSGPTIGVAPTIPTAGIASPAPAPPSPPIPPAPLNGVVITGLERYTPFLIEADFPVPLRVIRYSYGEASDCTDRAQWRSSDVNQMTVVQSELRLSILRKAPPFETEISATCDGETATIKARFDSWQLNGTVIDVGGHPLDEVSIGLLGVQMTDAAGRFTLRTHTSPRKQVWLARPGFEVREITVDWNRQPVVERQVVLERTVGTLILADGVNCPSSICAYDFRVSRPGRLRVDVSWGSVSDHATFTVALHCGDSLVQERTLATGFPMSTVLETSAQIECAYRLAFRRGSAPMRFGVILQ